MKEAINNLRLFLCTFSGEDDYIIRRCKPRIQVSFALIGLFVLVIFAGCWVSATAFMSELFGDSKKLFSVPIGILWALLIANLYLLLLYTISPTLLPTARKKVVTRVKNHESNDDGRVKSVFTVSFIFRICFISFLAAIIAQPLNVLWLSDFSNRSLDRYKTEYRVNMLIIADSSLIKQEIQNQSDFYQTISSKINAEDSIVIARNVNSLNAKVSNDKRFLFESQELLKSLSSLNKSLLSSDLKKRDSIRGILSRLLEDELRSDDVFIDMIDKIQFSNQFLQADFENYRNALKSTIQEKINNLKELNELLDKSNFYVKRIQILLSENPFSWILTLLVCFIFFVPIYWKFSIRNYGGFYEKKKHIENQFVLDDYNHFKLRYAQIFADKIRQYNRETWVTLLHMLNKIKQLYPDKYSDYISQIKNELTEENVTKYEYWSDHPFRTRKKHIERNLLSQTELLSRIYNSTET